MHDSRVWSVVYFLTYFLMIYVLVRNETDLEFFPYALQSQHRTVESTPSITTMSMAEEGKSTTNSMNSKTTLNGNHRDNKLSPFDLSTPPLPLAFDLSTPPSGGIAMMDGVSKDEPSACIDSSASFEEYQQTISTLTGGREGQICITFVPTATTMSRKIPPVAMILPPTQMVNLPTNSIDFSGIFSTDDIKVVSYVWELVSGPPGYEAILPSAQNVTLTNLIEGNYTIKLTVTDEDGLSDETTATLVVYPPITTTTTSTTTSTTTTYVGAMSEL